MNVANASTNPTFLGGKEKAYVRLNCWLPSLSDRRASKGSRIKLLTMPGATLTELELFASHEVIQGANDVIAVERNVLDYYKIVKGIPLIRFKYNAEPFVALLTEVNSAINDKRLDSFLPVDAINLDYCGFVWGSHNINSDSWLAIKRIISVQSRLGDDNKPYPFTLLLTVQGRGGAEASFAESLSEYKEDLGAYWGEMSRYPYHLKLLHALPLRITFTGFEANYDVDCTHRYVYTPKSINGSAKMLSFAFSFEPILLGDGSRIAATTRTSRVDARCLSILQSKPNHLVYDEQTTEIRKEEYSPSND